MSVLGVDISRWNGNVNFKTLKATGKVQFCVIKVSDGMSFCNSYINQLAGCKANNIPYAFYCFGQAKNIAEGAQEAKFLVSKIAGTQPLFIAYDAESSNLQALDKNTTTDVINSFLYVVKSAGYEPYYYCNENWRENELDAQFLKNKGYKVWCARYNGNTPNTANYSLIYDIWQYSDNGKLAGNGSSAIDMDVVYDQDLVRKINTKLGVNANPNYCDTNSPFAKNKGETYTFKTGSPIVSGNQVIFKQTASKIDNGYYFTTFLANGVGSAGFYMNGVRKTIGTVK